MLEAVIHPIEPLFNSDSEILILGSFPSPQSRKVGFFYGHPQNRFWKVLSSIYYEDLNSIEDKKRCCYQHHIALWDTIHSCKIDGAKDSSITDVVVNDLSIILEHSKVKRIYTTGRKSYDLYTKYCEPIYHIKAIYLPSTSPLNARMKLEDLIQIYQEHLPK